MENLIVIVIVAAAFFVAVRHFVRIFTGGKDAGGSCGCGCSQCDAASSDHCGPEA